MPEFQLSGRNNTAFQALSEFEQGYVEAAFFADTPDDKDWSFDDLSESALKEFKRRCTDFMADYRTLDLIREGGESQAGHDFWLTQQGHGAGFWDGDWDEVDPDRYLDKRARTFGNLDLYKGDDGLIYV